MKHLLLAITFATSLFGADVVPTYWAKSIRTSVTADKLTVKQATSGAPIVEMKTVVVQATVAGTVKFETGGTAPTTTEVTPTSTIVCVAATTSKCYPTSLVKAYSNSNVGAGTDTSITYKLTANQPLILSADLIKILGVGATNQVTVVVTLDSTGDVQTGAYWSEIRK